MKTVLLVDDVPANLGVLLEVLHAAGYDARVAESGERALQQMRRKRPDLVLLDVMMPGLDGLETCRRIKAEAGWADIPVLFMTALSDVIDKVKGFEAGAVDYLTKPLHPQEVLARVRVHLQLRDLQQSLENELAHRAALEAQLRQSLDRAVVMVARDGSVPFRTRRAEQVLARHGAGETGLPAALTAWLTRPVTGPLELESPAGRLRIRRFAEPGGDGLTLLVLEDEPAGAPALEPLTALGLTLRESEVLYWIAGGKTNPEIAIILDAAVNTVKKHTQNILEKLGVDNRTSAARVALDTLGRRE